MLMQPLESLKQGLTCYLMSVPLLRRNTYLLYSLWSVVLILSYYEFAFEVVHVFSSHNLNFMVTCCVNVIAYIFVETIHSRFEEKPVLLVCVCLCVSAHFIRDDQDIYLHQYDTGLDIVEQFGVTGVFGCILSYSSDVYTEVVSKNVKETQMGLQIQVDKIIISDKAYPRLKKLQTWLTTKYSNVFTREEMKTLCPAASSRVLIFLRSGVHSVKYQSFLQKEDIEDIVTNSFNSLELEDLSISPRDHHFRKTIPFVIICVISADENGEINKQDKRMLSCIRKYIFREFKEETFDLIHIFENGTRDDNHLKELSLKIQNKVWQRCDVNTSFSSTFIAIQDNNKIRKRVGLYLEKQLEEMIVNNSKDLMPVSETDEMTVGSLTKSKNKLLHDIIEQFQQLNVDTSEMHELEILLERNADVRAYGCNDNVITVYVSNSEKIPCVQIYLKEYFPKAYDKVKIEILNTDVQISKYHLQVGSKIYKDDERFGTLGMFLKDQKGSIYFTTCSHVVNKERCAYGNDQTVLGRSVHSIDTATDIQYTELVDLSIVKLDSSVISSCQFGLRNTDDDHVKGEIAGEDDIKSEQRKHNLKVYKWGAKTELTRGIYKGWLASKTDSCRFDQNVHRIVSDAHSFFAEGDSGSLICFEATGSPYLPTDSAVYIFVGKQVSSEELSHVSPNQKDLYYCYHVSKIFDQNVDDVVTLEPCLDPNVRNIDQRVRSGDAVIN